MNDSLFPSANFSAAANGHQFFDFATEAEVNRRIKAYEANRRDYFTANDWFLAGYALDLLLEITKGKLRNSGNSPEWIHSARPTEWVQSLINAKRLNRFEVEAKYGSLEIVICNWLLHDLGENEGVTATYLRHYYDERLNRDFSARSGTYSMARIDRKVDRIISDFVLLTNGKNGEVPFNVYLRNLSESPYAFMAKLGDRTDNMATLIGAKRPVWADIDPKEEGDIRRAEAYFAKIQRYNWHTYENFALHDLAGMACRKYPVLSDAFHDMDYVMGFLFRLNAAYTSFHPHNPKNAPTQNKRVVIEDLVLDVSKYWKDASHAVGGFHLGTNPMEIPWQRIKQEREKEVPNLHIEMNEVPKSRKDKPGFYDYLTRPFSGRAPT